MNDINLKDKVTDKVGEKLANQNPFITSQQFLMLMKAVAALAKTVIMGSTGPAECMNAIMSVVVTFLKNVPDAAWNHLKKCRAEGDLKSPVAVDMFDLLDKLRSYGGDASSKFVEVIEEEDDMPPVNAPMPNKPC